MLITLVFKASLIYLQQLKKNSDIFHSLKKNHRQFWQMFWSSVFPHDDEEWERMNTSSSSQQAGSRLWTSPPGQVSVHELRGRIIVNLFCSVDMFHLCKPGHWWYVCCVAGCNLRQILPLNISHRKMCMNTNMACYVFLEYDQINGGCFLRQTLPGNISHRKQTLPKYQQEKFIKPARSAGFSRIKKIPYQAPPTQLGPRKCTF